MESMRTHWFAAALALLVGPASFGTADVERVSGETLSKSLPGQWVGTFGDGEVLSLTFGPSDRAVLRVGKDVQVGTYTVDWRRQPAHLDLDWRPGRAGGKTVTIVEFLDACHVRIEDNYGKPRPVRFSDNSMILKRK